jgi:transmembrane sensor
MMKVNEPLDWDRLRDDVAAVQSVAVESDDVLRMARARFLLTAKGKPQLRKAAPRWPIIWAAAIAASLALGIASWVGFHPQRSLSFETGAEGASGELGALLSAQPAQTLPVRFSDGTILSMASASRARITETSADGATVVLEEGAISAAVVHREASRWHVAAGPFTVLVTGTKFDVRWSSSEQALLLDLHEGAVTVLGPSLGTAGRRVAPGESIRLLADPRREGAVQPLGSPGDTRPPESMGLRDDAPKSAAGDSATGATRTSWKQLALDEHYADALAAAETENFDAVCRRASGADLLLLANAARFAGSASRAEQAFRSVRSRFADTHEAAMAAFTLGRIAHDERRNYRAAAQWFQSYLHDEPGGGLAREAAGRLIEAYRAAGDAGAARSSAQIYLSKYPAGPHAPLARTLVSP